MKILQLTKEERNEIYTAAQGDHLNDVQLVKGTPYRLDGMCGQLKCAMEALHPVQFSFRGQLHLLGEILPEFGTMKPKNKEWNEFWWRATNTLKTRTRKYELLIKMTS